MFSVGGTAKNTMQKTITKLGKVISYIRGAKVNHLQILDAGTPVGFPNAKVEKVLEINETILLCNSEFCTSEMKKTPMLSVSEEDKWLLRLAQKRKERKYVIVDIEETIVLC